MYVIQRYYILVVPPPFVGGFEAIGVASSSSLCTIGILWSMAWCGIANGLLGLDLGGLIRYLPIEGAPFLVLS